MPLKVIKGGNGVPDEPDWADLYDDELDQLAAAEHWRTIVAAMRDAETIAAANVHAVTRLVLFYVAFDRSARAVAERGTVLKAPRSGVPQLSLSWVSMRQAAEACASLEAELGLSPRRRDAVGKARAKRRGDSPADTYLKRIK